LTSPRALLAPSLVALLVLAQSSGAGALAGALLAGLLLLSAIGPRWDLDRGRQIVASVIGAGAAYTLVSLLYEPLPGHLTEGWTRLSACLLMAAAARFVSTRPGGGPPITVLLLFLAVLVAGESRSRSGLIPGLGVTFYPILSFLFLLAALAALRALDPGRIPRQGRRWLAVAALLITSTALATVSLVGVRAAYARLMNRARSTSAAQRVQVGFSDQMELGALGEMLDSETIVLRVRGPRVDYLRGAAFNVYEVGRWRRSDALATEQEESWTGPRPEGASVVEIQALSEREPRFFLPMDARQVAPTPGRVKVDPLGIVKRAGSGDPLSARFLVGPRDRALLAPPRPVDLFLSRRVHTRLEELASGWTAGARSPEEKLDAIERHLAAEFRYARTFRRATDLDPALDFLLRDRTGHCEYFASGMVLLARAAGVPARVVTGYRVAEYNTLGGYHVVRERNAHAWVEAWIEDKGWVTRDPTPEGPLSQNRPHETTTSAALLDLLRVRYGEAVAWIGKRTTGQIAIASVLGLLILGWLVARGVQRRGKGTPIPEDEIALPWLRSLLDALASAGTPHDPHEALERLAARVSDPEVSTLLRRYEALRYGDQGDAAALEREARDCVTRLRRAATRAPG
jgi:transglutaminase-like putative cysteine protease